MPSIEAKAAHLPFLRELEDASRLGRI